MVFGILRVRAYSARRPRPKIVALRSPNSIYSALDAFHIQYPKEGDVLRRTPGKERRTGPRRARRRRGTSRVHWQKELFPKELCPTPNTLTQMIDNKEERHTGQFASRKYYCSWDLLGYGRRAPPFATLSICVNQLQ